MFWRKNYAKIKAVDDQDFPNFLRRIGVYDLVERGEALCKICGEKLTLDKIEAVMPNDGKGVLV